MGQVPPSHHGKWPGGGWDRVPHTGNGQGLSAVDRRKAPGEGVIGEGRQET